MEAIREVTDWNKEFSPAPNHIYLMDGDKAVAYIKWGKGKPQFFKAPLHIVKTNRKFVKANSALFGEGIKSELIEVKGSKGDSYFVDPVAKTCTCPGFQFRGKCKHLEK